MLAHIPKPYTSNESSQKDNKGKECQSLTIYLRRQTESPRCLPRLEQRLAQRWLESSCQGLCIQLLDCNQDSGLTFQAGLVALLERICHDKCGIMSLAKQKNANPGSVCSAIWFRVIRLTPSTMSISPSWGQFMPVLIIIVE